MSTPLPPHVAAEDEHMPAPGGSRFDGPDLREATPLTEMLDVLALFDDDHDSYLSAWCGMVREAGVSMFASRENSGEHVLMMGGACDAQIRHRSRYMHFLVADLDRVPGRRTKLMAVLVARRQVVDRMARQPRQVRDTAGCAA